VLFAVGGAIWMYVRRTPGPDAPGIYGVPEPA
jgi:hypothetical protein